MRKFIEVTGLDDRLVMVNIDKIAEVERAPEWDKSARCWLSVQGSEGGFRVKESYEEVKEMIRRAVDD